LLFCLRTLAWYGRVGKDEREKESRKLLLFLADLKKRVDGGYFECYT
jgi:hypothetical protein